MGDKENGKIQNPKSVLKIRDIGREIAEPEETTVEMRVKAANALGEILQSHHAQIVPFRTDVYALTILHILVSIGMKHVSVIGDEEYMRVAGNFRESVRKIWLKLGLSAEDCEVLNRDVIVMAPKEEGKKR